MPSPYRSPQLCSRQGQWERSKALRDRSMQLRHNNEMSEEDFIEFLDCTCNRPLYSWGKIGYASSQKKHLQISGLTHHIDPARGQNYLGERELLPVQLKKDVE